MRIFSEFSNAYPLLDQSPVPEGTASWFKAVSETTMGAGEESLILAASDADGVIRAVLPLVREKGGSLRSLTAPYTTIFYPGFWDPHWAHCLGAQAQSFVTGTLKLEAIDIAAPGTIAFLAGLKKSTLYSASFVHFKNWYEQIDDFESYWARRPAKLKSTVRRKLALLNKNDGVEFRRASEGGELATALGDYIEVYQHSWKPAEPHPQFMEEMVERLAAQNGVVIGTLKIKGRVIAAQIWLRRGDKATIFKLAHHRDFQSLSAGTLLTHWLVQQLCTEGRYELDFGRGNDIYKKDWLSQCRYRQGLIVANCRSWTGLRTFVGSIIPTLLSNSIRRTLPPR